MRKSASTLYRPAPRGETNQTLRIFMVIGFSALLFLILFLRLFQLQIIDGKHYSDIAQNQHYGSITLPAKRGEILVRDTHSGELSKLATNTTLDLVYVDPLIAEDKVLIAKQLAPLLFSKKDYDACVDTPKTCDYEIQAQPEVNPTTTLDTPWTLGNNPGQTVEVKTDQLTFKPYPQMVDEVAAKILRKISKSDLDYVVLKNDADVNLMADVVNEQLPGVFVDQARFMITADPTLIPANSLKGVAKSLSKILGTPEDQLEAQLAPRKVRYVFLKNKLDPEISQKIQDMNLKGIVLVPEHWRYYPEGSLAAHVVGFLNHDGYGQYGIEGYFNSDLEGKTGTIYASKDPFGRQITVTDSEIVNPVDGDSIVLTIDRIVQKKIEEILKDAVEKYHADDGQVIVMNPFTGAIIALASYPTFDPNNYTDAYTLRPVAKDEKIDDTVAMFKMDETHKYVLLTDDERNDASLQKYIFANKFGAEAFKDKVVSDVYEPGSAFKPVVMSAALDSKEVEPQTTFMDDGPLKIDDFTIKNSTNLYWGKTTMTQVLEKSLNTGMSWVAKQLGKELMYKYLQSFGFGDYTNITLEGENKGRLDYYKHWSKAQLLTQSFGQGIIVTPLQMAVAWSALANGGKLMQPYIVDSVIKQDGVVKTEPQVIRRAISEETSSIISSMLVSSVNNGYAHKAAIPGYLIAGKTGTSQIAGKNGKYESGDGTTVTSFGGFIAFNPQFVVLVKLTRPRLGAEDTWGENTAAPAFRDIAQFLIDYYNIQPSEKVIPIQDTSVPAGND
jgi:cell division protein FtsI (penicillin-binding protein 3)